MKPLAIDLFCGLGGWTEALLAEGWRVIGFDIERHQYWLPDAEGETDGYKHTKPVEKRGWTQGCAVSLGIEGATQKPRTRLPEYPGQLVLQDVRTLHGAQFKDADLIVASPPCQEFSYRAMPWKRAKALGPPVAGLELFWQCWRIQHEACEAAGRHIPMIVENVRGANPWLATKSVYNFGSFHLWGDVPPLMPKALRGKLPYHHDTFALNKKTCNKFTDPRYGSGGRKVAVNFHEHEKTGKPGRSFQSAAVEGLKVPAEEGRITDIGKVARFTSRDCGIESQKQPIWFNDDKRKATKCGGDWFGSGDDCSLMRRMSSKSSARKAASAQIAKIPPALARHIAQVFKP